MLPPPTPPSPQYSPRQPQVFSFQYFLPPVEPSLCIESGEQLALTAISSMAMTGNAAADAQDAVNTAALPNNAQLAACGDALVQQRRVTAAPAAAAAAAWCAC